MTVLLIAACSSQTGSLTPEPTTTIEPAPMQTAVVLSEIPNPLGDVKLYRDEKAGLGLDYPAALFIEDRAAQDASENIVYTVSLFHGIAIHIHHHLKI